MLAIGPTTTPFRPIEAARRQVKKATSLAVVEELTEGQATPPTFMAKLTGSQTVGLAKPIRPPVGRRPFAVPCGADVATLPLVTVTGPAALIGAAALLAASLIPPPAEVPSTLPSAATSPPSAIQAEQSVKGLAHTRSDARAAVPLRLRTRAKGFLPTAPLRP